ncbi:F-box protein At3g07870-like [Beta vulgaris subsp. vulgaris]|uniref:F-box protein At3g07870-like n=1 Tax=Beta vulgaris subsp. vulgaris TaxID=3555 RepID=UPI0020368D3C|nr:F-box protein At3g07870-like [Beta vulgaris subsp. vulgaris]
MVKKVKQNGCSFEEIPSPIIWDILSRLPTKACLMSKLVCKDWYGIITDPEFADFRHSHGCYSTVLLRGNFHCKRRQCLLLLDLLHLKIDETGNLVVNADEMIRFKIDFKFGTHQYFNLVNDCNGVIFLKSSKSGPYVVCNLLTGRYLMVKKASRPRYSVEGVGLGYCHVSKQFKVLRALKCHDGVTISCITEIQTIGTKKWRTISTEPLGDLFWDGTVFFKNSLHIYSRNEKCILSFHFGYEKFVRIPLPYEINRYNDRSSLCILDSCLCFSTISNTDHQCEIWAMKDYGVKDSWVKVAVVKHTDIPISYNFPSYSLLSYHHPSYNRQWYIPLLQMGSEKVLLASTYNCWRYRGLSVVDIESGEYKRISVLGVPTFSLLALHPTFSKLQKCSKK